MVKFIREKISEKEARTELDKQLQKEADNELPFNAADYKPEKEFLCSLCHYYKKTKALLISDRLGSVKSNTCRNCYRTRTAEDGFTQVVVCPFQQQGIKHLVVCKPCADLESAVEQVLRGNNKASN